MLWFLARVLLVHRGFIRHGEFPLHANFLCTEILTEPSVIVHDCESVALTLQSSGVWTHQVNVDLGQRGSGPSALQWMWLGLRLGHDAREAVVMEFGGRRGEFGREACNGLLVDKVTQVFLAHMPQTVVEQHGWVVESGRADAVIGDGAGKFNELASH